MNESKTFESLVEIGRLVVEWRRLDAQNRKKRVGRYSDAAHAESYTYDRMIATADAYIAAQRETEGR